MTESILDNMLGLVEMAIASAYGRPPAWCSVATERMRYSSGRKTSEYVVIYHLLGEKDSRMVEADCFSELLGKIARSGQSSDGEAVGRRVLVDKKDQSLVVL